MTSFWRNYVILKFLLHHVFRGRVHHNLCVKCGLCKQMFAIHSLNTLRPRQDGGHFPDDIFKWIILNENVWISINISLKFVPRGPINNIPTLVQVMAWRRPGDKPLSEPMMVRLPTHICVTRPQWVNPWDAPRVAYWLPGNSAGGAGPDALDASDVLLRDRHRWLSKPIAFLLRSDMSFKFAYFCHVSIHEFSKTENSGQCWKWYTYFTTSCDEKLLSPDCSRDV